MVSKADKPKYALVNVRSAAARLRIEFRGRKARLDALNLGYELNDIAHCLSRLAESDFRKTLCYQDSAPDDEYICNYAKPGIEHAASDRLYIKFCLIEKLLVIDLASFHLTRF